MQSVHFSILALLLLAAVSLAEIIHVPGEGLSIQEGIDIAAEGDTVLVAEGTYYENISFMGKGITLASTFIMDEDTSHISNTIINGSQHTDPDSGSVVYFIAGEDTTSVLYGFTITGGSGTKIHNGEDWARDGGGIFILNAGGKVLFNRIIDNQVSAGSGVEWADGAGVLAWGYDEYIYIIISGNDINNNVATGNRASGGGAALGTGGMIRFEGNTVKNNLLSASILNAGGGLVLWGGDWAGQTYNGSLIVTANLIGGNESEPGSYTGNYNGGGGVFFENCSAELINNIITGNTGRNGGGINVWTGGAANAVSRPLLMNNTIAANAAENGGGMFVSASHPKVINSILWGNNATVSKSAIRDLNHNTVVYNSVVEDVEWSGFDISSFNSDPVFADTLYNLSAESPCVGMGRQMITINEVTYEAPRDDFYGNPRPNGIDKYIDVGAVESGFTANAYPLDLALPGRYVEAGSSLSLTTEVLNPHSKDITVYGSAQTMEGVVADSTQLFDDGAHNDGSADDGVFGGSVENIDEEAFFRPGIGILDNGSDQYTVFNDNKIFTTIGPIMIDSISSLRQSAFDDTRFAFDIYLRNMGETATVKNISATIFPDTTNDCFNRTGAIYREVGDIAPGETVIVQNYTIHLNQSCIEDTIFTIPFSIEIKSDGYVFWTDQNDLLVNDIETISVVGPRIFKLERNYPNPFNPVTMINYQLPMTNYVDLSIYNLLGQKVAILVNEFQKAGYHQVEWDASGCASGVYYYKLKAGNFQDVKKMILLR